jgi:hypothetical protein
MHPVQELRRAVEINVGTLLTQDIGLAGRIALAASLSMAGEKTVPVVVTMHMKCGCGHAEDETYEFDMPAVQSKEEYVPGTCAECSAPIRIYLRRAKVLQ